MSWNHQADAKQQKDIALFFKV